MGDVSRQQAVTYALCAIAVALVGFNYLKHQGRTATKPPAPAVPVRLERAESRPVVHVAGAVRRPGVYRVRGERVADAVKRAGGADPGADLAEINLAAKLTDGQQIVVPTEDPATGPATVAATAGAKVGGAVASEKVSLGSATAEELDTLDGVGEVTAQKILDFRRKHGGFRSVEDLMQIPGIGEKRFEALKERVQP